MTTATTKIDCSHNLHNLLFYTSLFVWVCFIWNAQNPTWVMYLESSQTRFFCYSVCHFWSWQEKTICIIWIICTELRKIVKVEMNYNRDTFVHIYIICNVRYCDVQHLSGDPGDVLLSFECLIVYVWLSLFFFLFLKITGEAVFVFTKKCASCMLTT